MTISEQFVLEASNIQMHTIHDASATGNSVGVLATGEAKVAVTQSLPAGTANMGAIQITDGVSRVAVKAASGAPVAADPALVVTISPNTPSITFSSNLHDGVGNSITSDNNGLANNQRIHTATPDTTVASTALNALNASVTIAMAGLSSVGFQLAAGTFIGTIQPQSSIDGGTTWVNSSFFDSSNSAVIQNVVFGSSNTLKIYSILPLGGASHVRVTVSAYTSGTANSLLRASMVSGAAGAVTAAAFSTITLTYPSTVAGTPTLILAANPNRKYAMISSPSATVQIQLGTGTGLSGATGFAILTNGFYELKGDNLYTGNVYAFNSGAKALAVTEGTP